ASRTPSPRSPPRTAAARLTAPATSPAPRARTRSASTNANWPARWAAALPTPPASWPRAHERRRPADRAETRPRRLGRARRAATRLARLAAASAERVRGAGAGDHADPVVAAARRPAQAAPRPALGRHPCPVLLLPRRGRGLERAGRTRAGDHRDRADPAADSHAGCGRATPAPLTALPSIDRRPACPSPANC